MILIEPVGIEIYVDNFDQEQDRILIEPVGIEITTRYFVKHRLRLILIEPVGIEIA